MKKSTKVILWIASVCVSIAVGAGGSSLYYARILQENRLPAVGEDVGITNITVEEFKQTWELNDFEIDKETAIRIGDAALLYLYGSNGDVGWNGMTLQDTKYYISETSDGIAYFYTRVINDGPIGGDYNILISKQNGQIIGTWIGE